MRIRSPYIRTYVLHAFPKLHSASCSVPWILVLARCFVFSICTLSPPPSPPQRKRKGGRGRKDASVLISVLSNENSTFPCFARHVRCIYFFLALLCTCGQKRVVVLIALGLLPRPASEGVQWCGAVPLLYFFASCSHGRAAVLKGDLLL